MPSKFLSLIATSHRRRVSSFRCDTMHSITSCQGSRAEFRIRAVEIDPRQGQVHCRLAFRLVPCLEKPLGLVLVVSLEICLGAGDFVFEVEDAQGRRTRPYRCFIVSHMVTSVKRSALSQLASSGRALTVQRQNSARAVKQVKNPVKP
jgi:hypothetical protein